MVHLSGLMWNSLYFNFLAGWKDLGLASSEAQQPGIPGQGVTGSMSKALYPPPHPWRLLSLALTIPGASRCAPSLSSSVLKCSPARKFLKILIIGFYQSKLGFIKWFFFLRREDLEEIVYYPCSLEIDRALKQRKEIEWCKVRKTDSQCCTRLVLVVFPLTECRGKIHNLNISMTNNQGLGVVERIVILSL